MSNDPSHGANADGGSREHPPAPAVGAELATVGAALVYCEAALAGAGLCFGHGTDNPWDEAVQLVLAVAGLPLDSDHAVLERELTARQQSRLVALLQRRIHEKVPLPYLLGRAWFAGIEFLCDRRALVPRSPLAELIRDGFAPWYAGPAPTRLLDLCCGGGCIGLAAAYYHPDLHVDLLDIDPAALALARANVEFLGLGARARVLESDLFDRLDGDRYDIILSNPPYVDADDLAAMPAEFHHEPPLALGSGSDGLLLTRRILAAAAAFLEPHGLLVVEVGNSEAALQAAFPRVPFTWLEFAHGGHGVFVLSARELQDYAASFNP